MEPLTLMATAAYIAFKNRNVNNPPSSDSKKRLIHND